MQYGAGEPPHPLIAALSVCFATLAGLTFGAGGFFVATVFPALFAGELTGTISVYPWHARMYVIPGVLDRPSPPVRR